MSSEPAAAAGPLPARLHRPKTERFRALSILWCFPSLGALVILGLNGSVWFQADSMSAVVAGTRVEQWVALGLLLLHPVFLGLARHYRRTERPVELPPDDPEPDEPPEKIR